MGITSESYFNNNISNQENMGVKYFGKGAGNYISYLFSFNSKYFFLSAEPFSIISDNFPVAEPSYPKDYKNQNTLNRDIERPGVFQWLNDRPISKSSPYTNQGISEFQLYIKYNSFSIGLSNANRWWGPGIHTSLSMSNNTAGFNHYFFGINDFYIKKIKKLKFNFNYMVGEVGVYQTPFYFTGIASTVTHHSEKEDITIGFTRTYVSGGIELDGDRQWTILDAALLPTEGLLLSSKRDLWYTKGKGIDRWDQIMTFFAEGFFKENNIKVFFEIGFNDHLHNLTELRSHWDVSAAYLYGIRKYGLFGSDKILFGVEYLDMIQRTHSDHRGTTATWFDEDIYNSNSYLGRRWSAHSGPDSDDFFFYLGYKGKNLSIIPIFNYERHGVAYHFPPEVKIETRLDIRFTHKNWLFNIHFENEYFENIGFSNSNDNVWLETSNPGTIRRTKTIIFKLQKNLNFNI